MLFLMKAGKNRTARWQQNIDLPEAVQLPSIFGRLSAYVLVGFGRFLPSDYQSKKVSMFQWPTSEAPARCAPRFEDRPSEHRDRHSPMIQIVLQNGNHFSGLRMVNFVRIISLYLYRCLFYHHRHWSRINKSMHQAKQLIFLF